MNRHEVSVGRVFDKVATTVTAVPVHGDRIAERRTPADAPAGICFARLFADGVDMRGLVLMAGGARGAYQAGVLKRIAELASLRGRPSPFAIVTGASAGAINGTMLAAHSADFAEGAKLMAQLWSELDMGQVFRTDPASLTLGGLRWIRDLSLGGLITAPGARSLLDTTPLRALIARTVPFARIRDAIRDGHLYAVAISATSYHSGRTFTFVQGWPDHPVWVK